MHYSNLVIVSKSDAEEDLEAAVEKAMGPHEKHGGFWDWFQIGGRWSGVLDGYEPEEDPANQRRCEFCEEGVTTAAVAARFPGYEPYVGQTCIRCKGKGFRPTWPTDWKRHEGDIAPIETLTEEHLGKFFRVIDPDAQIFGGEHYEPWHAAPEDRFVKHDKPTLDWLKREYADHLVVVVDNHS